jgi:hypothetical protein
LSARETAADRCAAWVCRFRTFCSAMS